MGRRFLLIFASVAGLMLLGPGVAADSSGGSVHGRGSGTFPSSAQPFPGDRVQLKISARNLPDGGVQGHFNMLHQAASGGLLAHIEGDVDCLLVAGNTAVVTGVIRDGFATPFGIPVVGHEVSYTIVEGHPDSFAFGVDFLVGPQPILPCQSRFVFVMPLTKGHFTVDETVDE